MKKFAVIRPYPQRMRKRVFAFLDELNFRMGAGLLCPPGTTDEAAARWISRVRVDLLLLPYHLHRTPEGQSVDGISLARMLPPSFDQLSTPILMPVTKFSWEAGFKSKMATLIEERPRIASRIVAMREDEIGSEHIARRLSNEGRTPSTAPASWDTRSSRFPSEVGGYPPSEGERVSYSRIKRSSLQTESGIGSVVSSKPLPHRVERGRLAPSIGSRAAGLIGERKRNGN